VPVEYLDLRLVNYIAGLARFALDAAGFNPALLMVGIAFSRWDKLGRRCHGHRLSKGADGPPGVSLYSFNDAPRRARRHCTGQAGFLGTGPPAAPNPAKKFFQ